MTPTDGPGTPPPGGDDDAPLRRRLLQRVQASARAAAAHHTVRRRRAPLQPLAPGVRQRTLYRADTGAALRPGEPLCATLLEVAAGARWTPPPAAAGVQREWLLVAGDATLSMPTGASSAQHRLQRLDYLVHPGSAAAGLASAGGATVYVRDSPSAAGDDCAVVRVPERPGAWCDLAPRIQRRVLWQQGASAAMLYRFAPGVSVPHHGHRHDEECLMLEGEVFLDDVLLLAGDYQLAAAGSEHRAVSSDAGGILYAHGDLDLDCRG